MTTYTNKSKEKINKRDMINTVLSLQSKLDKANKHVVEKVCKSSNAILKLQSELAVSQQVNSLLPNRLTSIKCQCGARKWMKTFWRRKYSTFLVSLVLVSLQRELKPAIELAKKVQLVKFMKANDCQQVWSVKKGLLNTKMEVVTLPGPNKSLC